MWKVNIGPSARYSLTIIPKAQLPQGIFIDPTKREIRVAGGRPLRVAQRTACAVSYAFEFEKLLRRH